MDIKLIRVVLVCVLYSCIDYGSDLSKGLIAFDGIYSGDIIVC